MVKLYYKDKPVIGLDIGQTGVKVMAVDAKKWLVTGYGSVDLDPKKMKESIEGKDTYLRDSIRQLLAKNLVGSLPSNHTVLSIPASKTFTRTFAVPLEAAKNLKDAVQLEIEQYIPLPIETLYVDYEVIEKNNKDITVSLSSAPRALIDRYIEIAESADLRICVVEPGIAAVARVIETTEEGHLPTVLVDIGPASTDIAVLDNGAIRVTGSSAVGGNTFTLAIAKVLDVELENAHQFKVMNGLGHGPRQHLLREAMSPSLEKIINETRKVIRYYNERIAGKNHLEQLIIVGGGSNVPGIGEYFTNKLLMPARVASPWQRFDFGSLPEPAKQFRPRYITVAGLASVNPERILR